MRRVSLFAIMVILAGIILLSQQALGQGSSKVLLIPREGYSQNIDLMITMEVGVMIYNLKRAGFEVDIATTSGFPILGHNQKLDKVLRLTDINLDNYAGIIMACMAVGAWPGPPVSQETIVLVKKALADGKPVAASTFSVIILAEAGVLREKKYAFPRDPLKPGRTDTQAAAVSAGATLPPWSMQTQTDRRFVDAIYSGAGVVQDGKIITSGACPFLEQAWGGENKTVELTKTFIAAIRPK